MNVSEVAAFVTIKNNQKRLTKLRKNNTLLDNFHLKKKAIKVAKIVCDWYEKGKITQEQASKMMQRIKEFIRNLD